ncbi:RNA polymerase sigma factor [Nonomuraea fuscirosea]|uniref:RNA polymerase sigma factor n=1 Tax=Nonomuraea fuscirosea TaxID=1291556 RepID=UPI00343C123E
MTHRDRFEAVYDAYYPAIHQYAARRTGSADDTADVISETFLIASSPGGGWYEQSVPAERIKADWIVAGCRPYSSDTMEVYVKPGPGAGPAPDPRTVATPEWYDD